MENMMTITFIPLILFYCFLFIPKNSFGTMLPLEVIEITHHHHHHHHHHEQQQQEQLLQPQHQQQHHHHHHHQQQHQILTTEPTTSTEGVTPVLVTEHSTQVYNTSSSLSSSAPPLSGHESESKSTAAATAVGLNSRWNNLLNLNPNNNGINGNNNNNSSYNSSKNSDGSNNSSNNDYYNNNNINDIKHKSIYNHHSERRRSRQMLDILLQPQGTRILYQVGDSEEDLPICAPNAVCSKIDLYQTPWIERQCRCPADNIQQHSSTTNIYSIQRNSPIIITHHKNHHDILYDQQKYNNNNNKHYTNLDQKQSSILHKKLQQTYNDKRLEDIHLKRLMHKLDAVFQDDLLLDDTSNSFHDNNNNNNNENDNDRFLGNSYQNHNHKYDFNIGDGLQKEFLLKSHEFSKLRHSGHHKDFPKIGGCSSSLGVDDGHTIADKTRHYKLCNPINKLPICRYFRDYTWTLSSSPELNITEQIVHCRCPKNSITYLTKREPLSSGRPGYTYLFACSPQSRLRCQRKEPCKLFTLRKRQEFLDEVNTNPLCQCPKGYRCPKHHTDPGVIAGKTFIEDNIQTYSGYCMAND